MVSGIPAAMRALWPPFMEPHGAPGEISPALSPHVRLRVAEICTSHRREPQVVCDVCDASLYKNSILPASNDTIEPKIVLNIYTEPQGHPRFSLS